MRERRRGDFERERGRGESEGERVCERERKKTLSHPSLNRRWLPEFRKKETRKE